MPFKVETPILKDFHLEETDKAYGVASEPTSITVRQATQAAHERRAALFSQIVRELSNNNDQTVRLVQHYSFEELKRIEVMLTLSGCNILDADGQPLFKFDSKGFIRDEAAFNKAWGTLPPLVATEIHGKVLEVNIDWGPSGE